ncbi:MAG: RNA 2',3'-cyclic phosphodiesterase, partial [Candidatus Ratteibacteria bacterium]
MRVFSGIKLTDEVVDNLEQITVMLSKHTSTIKVVPAKNLHITLRFLGNIEEEKYQEFLLNLEDAFNSLTPFYVDIQGIGFFPNKRNVKVIWAGVKNHPSLLLIHD